MSYQLTYAGVPFVGDQSQSYRSSPTEIHPNEDADLSALRKRQPEADLLDELNRLIPFEYLQDFEPSSNWTGKKLNQLALSFTSNPSPNTKNKIGTWFYPFGVSRWSLFRGLATSKQVQVMLAATQGASSATFVMRATPLGSNDANYNLSTQMRMLPPRALGEIGGTSFDGLYLVTLVDERYYFQDTHVSLRVRSGTTWTELIATLGLALGVTVTHNPIDSVYGVPEPDSQLWTNQERAALLLDAVAWNLGCVVVRKLNGAYVLYSPTDSGVILNANRNALTSPTGYISRVAGGNIFQSGNSYPAGSLIKSKNAVIPSQISVTFPKYVIGNEPVPHFFNSRYANPRPTNWTEDSYGERYTLDVPITSGGPLVSGLIGTGLLALHSTAKAYSSGEAIVVPTGPLAGTAIHPINRSGLLALSMQLAVDRYAYQVVNAVDEVYPGTFAWNPESTHDILWTYSEKERLATIRVMRTAWNSTVTEFQHALHVGGVPGITTDIVPTGMGGHSVAQIVRDTAGFSGYPTLNYPQLIKTLTTSGMMAEFVDVRFLPTQNRWRGRIESEIILFEGTSGGAPYRSIGAASGSLLSGVTFSGAFTSGLAINVGIVYRGIDGTVPASHVSGSQIFQMFPDTTYGTNLVTYEAMQFAYPQDWTSGGIQGVNIVPQIQSVQVLDGCGIGIGFRSEGGAIVPLIHYSGIVHRYNPQASLSTPYSPWVSGELVWAICRNIYNNFSGAVSIQSGIKYGGQLANYSSMVSGNADVAPIYVIDAGDDRKACPGDTTTTTTTTTTTENPCAGTCVYVWSDTTQTWSLSSSDCNTGCLCIPPAFCGGALSCTSTITSCSELGGLPSPCQGTTTTGGPGPTTTTTCGPTTSPPIPPGADCSTGCSWIYLPQYGNWIQTAGGCSSACPCPRPTGVGDVCETASTGCEMLPPTTQPPSSCEGTCEYVCGLNGSWFRISSTCIQVGVLCSGSGSCRCDPPTGACDVCGGTLITNCWDHCPATTYNPCVSGTTTSPPTSTTNPPGTCNGYCLWRWFAAGAVWGIQSSVNCNGCTCLTPGINGTYDCETVQTPCGSPTTTTTATPWWCVATHVTCGNDPNCFNCTIYSTDCQQTSTFGTVGDEVCLALTPGSYTKYSALGGPYSSLADCQAVPCTTLPPPCTGQTCQYVCAADGTWVLTQNCLFVSCTCASPPAGNCGSVGSTFDASCSATTPPPTTTISPTSYWCIGYVECTDSSCSSCDCTPATSGTYCAQQFSQQGIQCSAITGLGDTCCNFTGASYVNQTVLEGPFQSFPDCSCSVSACTTTTTAAPTTTTTTAAPSYWCIGFVLCTDSSCSDCDCTPATSGTYCASAFAYTADVPSPITGLGDTSCNDIGVNDFATQIVLEGPFASYPDCSCSVGPCPTTTAAPTTTTEAPTTTTSPP